MLFGCSLCALSTAPGLARAQSQTSADDRVVFRRIALDRAQEARAAGRHEEALEFAQRGGAIQMTSSVRLFIAAEQSALARHADALRSALACVRESAQSATRGAEIRAACEEIARREQTLTGFVRVQVTGAPEGSLRLSVDGAEHDASSLGVPVPVDRGGRQVRVSAPGFVTQEREVRVEYGATVDVTVNLAPESQSGPARVGPPRPARAPERGPGAGPWALVGVGGTLVLTSGAFLLGSVAALSDCSVEHGVGVCDSSSALRRANDWSAVTLYGTHVSLYAGIAAATAGLLWWGLAPRGRAVEEGARPSVTAWASPLPGGALAGLRVVR